MLSLVEISPVVLEKKFLKVRQCIFAISYLSPLGKGWGPLFEQTWISLTQECLCQVWLKLTQRSWTRRFLNFVNVFPLFCYYLPLEKDRVLHSNKLETPSPKDVLCQVWLKLTPWFWRRRFLNTITVNVFSLFCNVNVEYLQTDGRTDGRQVIRKAH